MVMSSRCLGFHGQTLSWRSNAGFIYICLLLPPQGSLLLSLKTNKEQAHLKSPLRLQILLWLCSPRRQWQQFRYILAQLKTQPGLLSASILFTMKQQMSTWAYTDSYPGPHSALGIPDEQVQIQSRAGICGKLQQNCLINGFTQGGPP